MRSERGSTLRIGRTMARRVRAAGLAAAFSASGCGLILGPALPPGTYSSEIPCQIVLVDPFGAEATESFTMSVTLHADADGGIIVNDAPVAVGETATRSIPTADLGFEITDVSVGLWAVTVDAEPRPTLPGITVAGELRETYRRSGAGVLVQGRADLDVTDVSGTTSLTIVCTGELRPAG
jgi:hypothetical protein